MAKSGSTFFDSRNASSASSYQKECNAASPRRKCACAFSDPEVGNSTRPSCDSCALTLKVIVTARTNDRHIIYSPKSYPQITQIICGLLRSQSRQQGRAQSGQRGHERCCRAREQNSQQQQTERDVWKPAATLEQHRGNRE